MQWFLVKFKSTASKCFAQDVRETVISVEAANITRFSPNSRPKRRKTLKDCQNVCTALENLEKPTAYLPAHLELNFVNGDCIAKTKASDLVMRNGVVLFGDCLTKIYTRALCATVCAGWTIHIPKSSAYYITRNEMPNGASAGIGISLAKMCPLASISCEWVHDYNWWAEWLKRVRMEFGVCELQTVHTHAYAGGARCFVLS